MYWCMPNGLRQEKKKNQTTLERSTCFYLCSEVNLSNCKWFKWNNKMLGRDVRNEYGEEGRKQMMKGLIVSSEYLRIF